jgi:hypothetical protein
MANPARGSVAFQVGEKAYTISFSINALCELEALMDQPVARIAKGLEDPESVRMATVRALVWASLRDSHKDVDLKGAGDILEQAGMQHCMEAIGRAFALAFPEATEDANPPKAKSSGR